MKRTILLTFTIFSLVSVFSAMSLDKNNNNIKCPELPRDTWKKDIVEKLVNIEKIKEAKTLLELKDAVKGLYKFSLISKKCSEFGAELLNLKLKINGQEITLHKYYIQRKNEITQEIKRTLMTNLRCIAYNWFVDINSVDKLKFSALMFAVIFDNKEIVKLLIENGIDLNTQDVGGKTALMLAIESNKQDRKEIAEFLIENGANLNIQDKDGQTALTIAISLCRDSETQEIVKFLVESGADINIEDKKGKTAVDHAFESRLYEIVTLLIKNGARLQDKSNKGNLCIVQ